MKKHHEKHSHSMPALKDFVLGMSDGLTVPFALTAGLAGALDSTHVVVTAGLAEIVAGAISMGVGGYLSAKAESDHYDSEYERELREIEHVPEIEAKEVEDILREFGLGDDHLPAVVGAIRAHPKRWADFMMRFELGLERPDATRRIQSPLIIGGSYAVGGFLPLVPYFFCHQVLTALILSALLTLAALVAFGVFKGYVTGSNRTQSAVETTLTVAAAAACAFGIARLWGQGG